MVTGGRYRGFVCFQEGSGLEAVAVNGLKIPLINP